MRGKSTKILNGNELIVQGALEAGFSLYTGYPGSPLADFFNILYHKKDELQKDGIRVAIANSEANAAAMASGAKQAGRNCLVAMKSMGLHVASDALSVGNFANPGPVVDGEKSGVVIVVGDDPWSISTSTPADSRYLFKHLHIPFLEPSSPQELKDWIAKALSVSKASSVYVGVLLTTYMAEGGGRVEIHDQTSVPKDLSDIDPATFNLAENVMVPPNSLGADRVMITERFPKMEKAIEDLNLDQIFGVNGQGVGFISSAAVFETLKQVFDEYSLTEHFPLYKAASSYPLNKKSLFPFLKSLQTLVVVEEKRGFLEDVLREYCHEEGLNVEILGKKFRKEEGFPAYGGISYEIITDKLGELFSLLSLSLCELKTRTSLDDFDLPKRLPTFCPGCPHRETLSLLKEIRRKLKDDGIDLITHGDVGCYSLSFLPPFKEMHNLSAMGQGGALGSGMDLFTSNPSVVLMGDSTFYHSGLTDISNSVQMGHDITYILLNNDNTAMTGHQMTLTTGESVEGMKRPRQDMASAARALGASEVMEVNPSDRFFYLNLLNEVVRKPGVKVIVSNKECALTFHGRKRKEERKHLAKGQIVKKKEFYQINTLACEDCRVCVEETGCPGLSKAFDAYGDRVTIDPDICVSDGYCTKIKACPSFEKVTVLDYHPTKYRKEVSKDSSVSVLPMPTPKVSLEQIAAGKDFRIVVTGVGGSGITTISKVISNAALRMGGRSDIDFKFVDQKGLAQRNGNVTGHLSLHKKGKSHGPLCPKGTADLYLSTDLLDGTRHLSFLGEDGLAIIDKTFQVPLSLMLDKESSFSELELKEKASSSYGDRLKFYGLRDLSTKFLGKNIYTSAIILGVSFQEGRIPFTHEDMIEAINKSVPPLEIDNNIRAFELGRRLVVEGDSLSYKKQHKTSADIYYKSIEESFLPWISKKSMISILTRHHSSLNKAAPYAKQSDLIRYLHDLFIYDRGSHAEDFIKNAGVIDQLYNTREEKALALRVLAKTYFIKDEIFVSHMMISPLKKKMDQERYDRLGKKFIVSHINRPSFEFFGKTLEFDLSPRPWMVKMMRHMRILRYILIGWHKREKEIASRIRMAVLEEAHSHIDPFTFLKKLDNVKGYRKVRYEAFDKLNLL